MKGDITMLTLLGATINVSLLGFALAILYYLHFSQRQPMLNRLGKVGTVADTFLSSKVVTAAAALGLGLFVVLAPAVALAGIETIYVFLQGYDLSAHDTRLIAGVWIEASIIAGWLFEYYLQRESRNLPAIRFSFP